MDKFVQLPFTIPPISKEKMRTYAELLLSEKKTKEDKKFQEAIKQIEGIKDPELIYNEVNKIITEIGFDESRAVLIQARANQTVNRIIIDKQIDEFSDDESNIRVDTINAAELLGDNPRELKRFINTFRMLTFLKIAMDSDVERKEKTPSLKQIQRWIVLSLKWPEASRWIIRESYCREEDFNGALNTSARKLQALEELSELQTNSETWLDIVEKRLNIDPKKNDWILDPSLAEFFLTELNSPDNEKISNAVGLGLW